MVIRKQNYFNDQWRVYFHKIIIIIIINHNEIRYKIRKITIRIFRCDIFLVGSVLQNII